MRYIFALILVLPFLYGYSQSGNYFLSHYSPGKDRLDNVCFQIAQHENGLMYYATRSGVLQFDGRSWNLVQGNGAVYTLQITDDGSVFWGGVNGFGIVEFNEQGFPESKLLSTDAKNIFQSSFSSGKLHFLNEEKLYVFDPKTKAVSTFNSSEATGSFSGLFEIAGQIYVGTSTKKLYKLNEKELARSTAGFDSMEPIVFSSGFKDKYLIALSNSEVFISEKGRKLRQIVLEDQDYIARNVIVSGSWVNDQLIVLGTLRGGLVFINILNGKTHEIINYSTGLPDNEIYTLFHDKSQSIWAAHEYGFTRIVPYLPFRSFNHYQGLQGNLLCAITYQNQVYAGTSLGLYKLVKEDLYEDVSYYVDMPNKEKGRKKTAPSEVVSVPAAEEESKRKGLLHRLFRRNADPSVQNSNKASEETRSIKEQSGRIKRTEKVFRSSRYVYKKVSGIEAKVTQLQEIQGKLIAGGLAGVYQINDLGARLLIEAPTRYLFGSKDYLFISTYSDRVITLFYDGRTWARKNLLDNLSDQVGHIFEGPNQTLWLCSLDKIYQMKIDGSEVRDLKVVPIDNPNYDEFVGVSTSDQVVLANSQGFYSFNDESGEFQQIDSLSQEKLTNYFAYENTIWYKDSHGWRNVGENRDFRNLGLLNLFQNIRYLAPNKKTGDLWIITGNNELFKFFSDRVTPYSTAFPLTFKSARNGEIRLGKQHMEVRVDQDFSSLTVEVVQPDYLASQAIEYRYHLRGLEQNWTDWSKANSEIEIPYLPAGDYLLEVQSKNIFGQIQNISGISLIVIPPYWKRPWFYALEVLFFSLLVIMSFRLSTRYRIISRLLMLLTIIMLIQFIETIVGQTFETTTSPVIDFFVQVVIAMLVLPIEGYLRERMLRSLDSNNRFYRFISPKVVVPTHEKSDDL